MKLYMHPVSMTSRAVRLFIAESGIELEEVVVDLMTGEHHKESFAALNPNKLVPLLVDDDLRLTESSAILKYLADKYEHPAYPKDLKQRAKVNELMDWFNTNFYRDWAYNLAYPQIFPNHKRASDDVQQATLAWGSERSKGWLTVLDKHWLGPKNQWVTGSNQITIADYFGACLVTLGEVLRCNFAPYPNVQRWLGNVKQLKSWEKVNKEMYGLAGAVKDMPFVTV
jgi:glutathione S-transferase